MHRKPIPMLSAVSYGRPFNGSRPRYTRLGYVTTTEPKTHRVTYETASWYTDVEVPPGRYEVTTDGYWVFVAYVGTIVDEHFVNRLLGSSSVAPKRNIGQERTCGAQMNAYRGAEMFATDPSWTLCEDLRVEMTQSKSEIFPDHPPFKHFKIAPVQ